MNSQITNQYLDDISWINFSGFDLVSKIDVWRIKISPNLPFITAFLLTMSIEEIARANKFYQTKDRNRYIIGRGAIRNIIGKYLDQPASSIKFREGINRKPYLDSDKSKLFHNISYSGDWILLAIANSEIGADTELISHNFNFKEIIHQNFSDAEVNYINNGLCGEYFFLLWTRKEALIKGTGKGLGNYLKLIPVLDGIHSIQSDIISSTNDWEISSFKIDDNYIASIATSHPNEIRFRDVDFELL